MTRLPIMEEGTDTRVVAKPSVAEDAVGMIKLDKPMPLNEALRIIRGVAEHNTEKIPSPQEIAEAVGRALSASQEFETEVKRLRDTLERASVLMGEASRVLEDAWCIAGKLGHPGGSA